MVGIIKWACTQQNLQNDVCPAKTQTSLGICPVWSEFLLCAQWKASSCGQWRLIRLGGCPGWSESSLGAQIILLLLSCCSWNRIFFLKFGHHCIMLFQFVFLYLNPPGLVQDIGDSGWSILQEKYINHKTFSQIYYRKWNDSVTKPLRCFYRTSHTLPGSPAEPSFKFCLKNRPWQA